MAVGSPRKTIHKSTLSPKDPIGAQTSTSGPTKCRDGRLYFIYLIVNYDASKRTNTFIGKTKRCTDKLNKHNHGKVKSARYTRAAAGKWVLCQILGPVDHVRSMQLVAEWRYGTKGIPMRMEKGEELGRKHGLDMFTCSEDEQRGMLASACSTPPTTPTTDPGSCT
jgi:hypothetical protein